MYTGIKHKSSVSITNARTLRNDHCVRKVRATAMVPFPQMLWKEEAETWGRKGIYEAIPDAWRAALSARQKLFSCRSLKQLQILMIQA